MHSRVKRAINEKEQALQKTFLAEFNTGHCYDILGVSEKIENTNLGTSTAIHREITNCQKYNVILARAWIYVLFLNYFV